MSARLRTGTEPLATSATRDKQWVVVSVAVHVVQLQSQGPTKPLVETADLAAIRLEPLVDQPCLDVTALAARTRDEKASIGVTCGRGTMSPRRTAAA
jgi:hypothetical protein